MSEQVGSLMRAILARVLVGLRGAAQGSNCTPRKEATARLRGCESPGQVEWQATCSLAGTILTEGPARYLCSVRPASGDVAVPNNAR